MALVDIVMPLYNKAETVARSIESIRHQTLTEWHLIVVDDGSTDGGAQIVREIDDERIEVISQKNQGPGAARNVGIRRAEGQYLAFLDADDEWYPWYLANGVKAIEDNEVGFVVSMYYEWPRGEDMTDYWVRRNVPVGMYDIKGDEDPVWVDDVRKVVLAWNTLMRRELAEKYGGFYDKNHCVSGEDTIFFVRLVFGEPFMIIAPAAVRYHSETSVLGHLSGNSPAAPPYLIDPDSVLGYCEDSKRELLQRFLDHAAVGIARRLARMGRKAEALDLLERYPGASVYEEKYRRCRHEISFSRYLPYWIRFKGIFSRPIRSWWRARQGKTSGSGNFPKMPYEKVNTIPPVDRGR
ncbi:MAG: glycosyltransferase family 2 protein [Planctomycetes bacterium]|nr:glycosyltransferase family 2 protein [Planctomycetota bacterium]